MVPATAATTLARQGPATTGARRPELLSAKALRHVLVVSLCAAAVVSVVVLVGLGGLRYYSTPLRVRGYDAAHAWLRPSGTVGIWFGVAGLALMCMPFAYMLRKRLRWLKGAGNINTLLELHIFCGIVGPVLITYHTAFKFNGLVSVAYWSMMTVMLSGFVGRYLYVQIPRTIRGQEVAGDELSTRAQDLMDRLALVASPELVAALERLEHDDLNVAAKRASVAGVFLGGLRIRWRFWRLATDLRAVQGASAELDEVLGIMAERSHLLRRLAYLHRTKRLFELWHVFHLPLVYTMLAIVVLHVAIVVYLGYVPILR